MDSIRHITKNKTFLLFLATAAALAALQYQILKPHLQYGFADVDWGGLLKFKYFENPYTLKSLAEIWSTLGVYTSQAYYIGIQEHFFGLGDYRPFQQVAFVMKFLSTITLFPLTLIITKRKLAAFLTTFIYTISYTSVAALYTVMTTINYLGIASMNIFLFAYWYVVSSRKTNWKWLLLLLALFLLTLFLATERMYPLVPLIFLSEIFFWWYKKFSRDIVKYGVIRLLVLSSPLVIAFLRRASLVNTDFSLLSFFGNTKDIIQKLSDGNWQLLFNPSAALGSMIVPPEYLRILGNIDISSFTSYLKFLSGGPLLIFGSITFFSAIFLAKKKLFFIIQTLAVTYTLMLISFFIATHHLNIAPSLRMHFDPSFVMPPTLTGLFLISLSLSFLREWLIQGKKNILLLSLFAGPAMAFLFIFLTWIPSDVVLVFMGIHRYLTVASIGVALATASFLILIFDKLKTGSSTKHFSLFIFLILVPIFFVYTGAIAKYFDKELYSVGMNGADHQRMKGKLISNLTNFSETEPSAVYFDESQDSGNGYFNETTVMAGFDFWMMFRERKVLPAKLTPLLVRSYYLCGGTFSTCPEKLKEAIIIKNGVKGFMFSNKFFKVENFYAFRFKNRELSNIKPEIMQSLGFE